MTNWRQAAGRAGILFALAVGGAACAPRTEDTPTPAATSSPANPPATLTRTLAAATATSPATETAGPPSATPMPTPTPAAGRIFTLVPGESQASYTVDEEFFAGAVERLGRTLGWFTTVGVTDQMTGTLVLDPTADGGVELIAGEFVVNVRALESDSFLRDERIQTEWLVSNVYPEARFVAATLEDFPVPYTPGEAAMFGLAGDLTLHGVTRAVTFSTTATLAGDTLSGVATAPVLMTDFGFDPPEIPGFMRVEDEALITLNFVFRETTP